MTRARNLADLVSPYGSGGDLTVASPNSIQIEAGTNVIGTVTNVSNSSTMTTLGSWSTPDPYPTLEWDFDRFYIYNWVNSSTLPQDAVDYFSSGWSVGDVLEFTLEEQPSGTPVTLTAIVDSASMWSPSPSGDVTVVLSSHTASYPLTWRGWYDITSITLPTTSYTVSTTALTEPSIDSPTVLFGDLAVPTSKVTWSSGEATSSMDISSVSVGDVVKWIPDVKRSGLEFSLIDGTAYTLSVDQGSGRLYAGGSEVSTSDRYIDNRPGSFGSPLQLTSDSPRNIHFTDADLVRLPDITTLTHGDSFSLSVDSYLSVYSYENTSSPVDYITGLSGQAVYRYNGDNYPTWSVTKEVPYSDLSQNALLVRNGANAFVAWTPTVTDITVFRPRIVAPIESLIRSSSTSTNRYMSGDSAPIHFFNDASENWTLNISGVAFYTQNASPNIVKTMTVLASATNGKYMTNLTIDTSATVSLKWLNGAAPTSGGGGIDLYQFHIIPVTSTSFTVLAHMSSFV